MDSWESPACCLSLGLHALLKYTREHELKIPLDTIEVAEDPLVPTEVVGADNAWESL